jgi:hypothetical protein
MSGDLIKAAGLWLKRSKNDREYLVGRWGGCRILVFENSNRTDESEPSHFLMLGQAEDKRQESQPRAKPRGQGTWDRSRDHDRPSGETREYRNERSDPRQQRIDELAGRFEPDTEPGF